MLVRLWRAGGRECPESGESPFADIAAGSVYAAGIACLHALGITNGTTATTYSPDQPVTRAQIASLVIRLYDAALALEDTDDTAG